MQNKRKNCFHNNCCLTLSKISQISLIFKSTSGIEMSSGVATLPCFYYQYKIVLSLSLNCRINMKILFVYPARLDSLVSLFMQTDSVSFGDGSRDSQPPPLTRCLSISFSLCFSLSLLHFCCSLGVFINEFCMNENAANAERERKITYPLVQTN